MADGHNGSVPPRRDVRNHMLFEISTEVANRGAMHSDRSDGMELYDWMDANYYYLQLAAYILSSNPKPR